MGVYPMAGLRDELHKVLTNLNILKGLVVAGLVLLWLHWKWYCAFSLAEFRVFIWIALGQSQVQYPSHSFDKPMCGIREVLGSRLHLFRFRLPGTNRQLIFTLCLSSHIAKAVTTTCLFAIDWPGGNLLVCGRIYVSLFESEHARGNPIVHRNWKGNDAEFTHRQNYNAQ